MAIPVQLWLLPASLVVLQFVAGCSSNRAYTEWVRGQPEPVTMSCSASGAQAIGSKLPARVVMGTVQAGPGLSAYAGNLDQPPNPRPVPFSIEAPPVNVLAADLAQTLSALQPDDVAADANALRLDATLHVAFVHRTFYVLKSSEMVGRVIFDFAIVEPGSLQTNWSQRITVENRIRPGYITSRSVEEALNGAYCKALADFEAALTSPKLQSTLKH